MTVLLPVFFWGKRCWRSFLGAFSGLGFFSVFFNGHFLANSWLFSGLGNFSATSRQLLLRHQKIKNPIKQG